MSETPTPSARPRVPLRVVRDLAAVILMTIGVTGFITTAFLISPLHGLTATSLAVTGAGVLTGLSTSREE